MPPASQTMASCLLSSYSCPSASLMVLHCTETASSFFCHGIPPGRRGESSVNAREQVRQAVSALLQYPCVNQVRGRKDKVGRHESLIAKPWRIEEALRFEQSKHPRGKGASLVNVASRSEQLPLLHLEWEINVSAACVPSKVRGMGRTSIWVSAQCRGR